MSFDIIIDWEEYKTDFRGHEVTMQLRPLKRWASILLTPIIKRSTEKALELEREKALELKREEKQDKEQKKITEDDINFVFIVQEVAEKVFPKHIKDFSGITVNKQDVTIQVLVEESVFAPLCMDIIGELAKRSQLIEEEVKNSNGPSITQPATGENTGAK